MNKLNHYLESNFPGLLVKPSLYHQWSKGIHFDLAKGLYQLKSDTDDLNPEYFDTVYKQAIALFEALFSADDKIILVTNIYQNRDFVRKSNKKIKVYRHFIKGKDVRIRLGQQILPFMFDDEDDMEGKCTSQFYLECQKEDIRYPILIRAICNQDFHSLKPRLYNPYELYEPDVFFINMTKNLIYYIYDDRGCEVIASDIETIRPIYAKFESWIGDYCREEIEQRFAK
ncbi:DUF3885 domain-containing protein [Ornithinibacillus scapharcae]|uniref:DUF3885 domain-containing protein n=1 Tax=Ornithinibacillus scapharcae TaxID=1147159 RepID=UPI000225B0AD|nr:DUF3885 domain-containing protein [Ornithinibacillus scapharcae]